MITQEHIDEFLRQNTAREGRLLDNMLAKCSTIKKGLPQLVNRTIRLATLIFWGILLSFIISALVFTIGQQEYGLWETIILSDSQRSHLSAIGVLLTFITGTFTIITYKTQLQSP